MINIEPDVLGRLPVFVFDCEWVGDMSCPDTTHLTEIAVYSVRTAATYYTKCTPLASDKAVSDLRSLVGFPVTPTCETVSTSAALVGLLEFVEQETCGCTTSPTFVAHNGVRYDVPVLLHSMQKCNLVLPKHWHIMDSLHHARFHMRHRHLTSAFSLHMMCSALTVKVDSTLLHGALYDTMLLHRMLESMAEKFHIPYISGYAQQMSVLSPMLIHGVGPTVCLALGVASLHELCTSVLQAYGSLTANACGKYLTSISIESKLPKANVLLIAQSVEPAAIRYLHYLP